MISTIIIFLIILGVLVFVHELGHFLAAKKAGAKVEEFAIGFPPRVFSIKKGETEYSINLIPLGGYVKILGEDGSKKDDPKSFASQRFIWKVIILVAGVTMNMLLAMVLLSIGFMIGFPQAIEEGSEIAGMRVRDEKVQVYNIVTDSPAAEAGINEGDQIAQINGVNITEVEQLVDTVNENKGKEADIFVVRGEESFAAKITPRENPPDGEGALGVSPIKTGIVSFLPHQAIWRGFVGTITMTIAIVFGFAEIIRNLFSGSGPGVELAGPVGIAALTGQAAKLGFAYLIQLTVLLSINLAIINILPFPALDGGRLLLVIVEKIRKKPLNPKIEGWIHASGFIFLMGLMVVVTFMDVVKFKDAFINIWNNITGIFS